MVRIYKSSTKAAGENSTFGLVLLLASLCLDGLTSSNQKIYRKEYSSSTGRGALVMMLHTNLWACIHVGILSIATGDAQRGLDYCLAHSNIVPVILKFALCSACGQCFIFLTITGP